MFIQFLMRNTLIKVEITISYNYRVIDKHTSCGCDFLKIEYNIKERKYKRIESDSPIISHSIQHN